MSLMGKLAPVLAAGALVTGGLIAATPVANATGNPSALDRGDLTIACRIKEPTNQYGWTANLLYGGAYGWRCVYLGNNSTAKGIDVNNYCMQYYGSWATATNPSDPYSWKCQGY